MATPIHWVAVPRQLLSMRLGAADDVTVAGHARKYGGVVPNDETEMQS